MNLQGPKSRVSGSTILATFALVVALLWAPGRAAAHGDDGSMDVQSSAQTDQRPAGVRDAAVIGLAYLSGTRRAELANLHLADLHTDPAAIRVVGKGGKQRLVPLSPTIEPLLEAWTALRGHTPGPLFCPIDRAGTLRLGRALTGEAIRQILTRRATATGLAAISPHDLRRTYAGDLLDAGADLPAVQQLMGHASPSTTSRYDRRGDRARRTAAERPTLHPDPPSGDPERA